MLSKYIPNFLLLSNYEMILFVISLVFTTAAGVTAFLHFSCKSFSRLKIGFDDRTEIIYSKELETHLGVLERKLIRKAGELKASARTESLEKLVNTQAKVKKYYVHLKEEIKNSEDEFAKIQAKIDSYRKQRVEIEQQMKLNDKYYNNLLRAVPKALSADVLRPVGALKDAADQQNVSKSSDDDANGICAKKSFNLCERNTNVETSKTSTTNTGTSGSHTPIFDSVKKLRTRFSGPVNLDWCGSISCSRNCVASKNLKVESHSQQPVQDTVASATEKVAKTLSGSTGSAMLFVENRA
ncbi:uncharacterized protein LOC116164738 [Photinus pyralis]|nr:uncharacterized protein LOC116164738 [Photinus pyralis]